MIKVTQTDIFGFEAAVRGARNAYQSWDKSDSHYFSPDFMPCLFYELGSADLALLSKLSKAGADHGKFMRMIHVQANVEAPLYWWKEADTYRIGVTANSTSTMHSIHKKEFSLNDFSCEHLTKSAMDVLSETINALNEARDLYLHWDELQKDRIENGLRNQKDVWWQMIQLLPASYNQIRTIDLNYAVLKNMYHARKNHKLDEWHKFCEWIETLRYAKELIICSH